MRTIRSTWRSAARTRTPPSRASIPGQSADTLYVTNGETTDYAETSAGTIAYTPELGEGVPGAGFVFPDDEGLIQAEFEKTLDFHLGLARSAQHPGRPGLAGRHRRRAVLPRRRRHRSAERAAVAVRLQVRRLLRRPAGGARARQAQPGRGHAASTRSTAARVQSASTSEWDGGERYGPGNGVYYHVVSGQVTGTDPGDSVKVWFDGRRRDERLVHATTSSPTAAERVLVLSAEDYTGASPAAAAGRPPTTCPSTRTR